MSIIVLSHVLRYSEAKLGPRLVLIALAEFAHDDGSKAFPSIETLIERTRLSRSGVKAGLKKLKEDGEIIETGQTRAGTKIYRVVMGGSESDRGSESGPGEGQNSTSEGSPPDPNPSSKTGSGPVSSPCSSSRELPEFGEWMGYHAEVTGSTVLRAGTVARKNIAAMYGARREEGYSHEELKLAIVGAWNDEYRRQNGHFGHESVLRPKKVAELIQKGRRHVKAQGEERTDWRRFDD